jgi:hypothetical protein
MAFKLTYSDGQEDDYDDSTHWVVEDGVLKMGREADKWTVLVSPSHWATIEVKQDKEASKDQAKDEDKDDEDEDKDDEDEDKDDEDEDKDDEDEDKDDEDG